MKHLLISTCIITHFLCINLFAQEDTLKVANGYGEPGTNNNPVDIELWNSVGIGGVQFTIRCLTGLLTADSIHTTSRSSHMDLGFTIWSDSIKVILYSISGDSIVPGEGPIVTLFFSVSASAILGDSVQIHLDDCTLSDPQAQPVTCVALGGWFYFFEEGIEEASSEIPKIFSLSQNSPNPFNRATTIMYQLPLESNVSLKVYDITGSLITTLVAGDKEPGFYTVTWNAADYPTGIYFVKLTAGSFAQTRKLILMR